MLKVMAQERLRLGKAFVALIGMVLAAPTSVIAADLDGTPAVALAHETAAGWSLTDMRGMTLYTNDRDRPSKSACNNKCAETWPPLVAAADAKAAGQWSVITRDDGSTQWAIRGKPLYTYIKDTYPGAAVGHDVQSVWQTAFVETATPPGMTISQHAMGKILTDSHGMTIYTRKQGDCIAACLKDWKPVIAPWLAINSGEWNVVNVPGETRQWAHRGKALYTYARDADPGEISGNGVDGVWDVLVLQPSPPVPPWVTVQDSDMGQIFADAKGMTIYVFSGDMERVRRSTCNDECLKTFWRPVLAEPGTQPLNNWSGVEAAGGSLQWTFRGERLYTFARDMNPGQILGDKYGSGHGKNKLSGGWWRPIRPSCMCAPASGS